MATRYSGNLKIDVRWVDTPGTQWKTGPKKGLGGPHGGYYRVAISKGSKHLSTQYVHAPSHLTHAIDSAAAYDGAAHAGLSFAADDGSSDEAAMTAMGSGGPLWHIGRTKATAWPNEGRASGVAPSSIDGRRDPTAWYPASGGTEPVFQTRSGRRLQYMFQPSTGRHAYLDVDNDRILSDKDAEAYLGP